MVSKMLGWLFTSVAVGAKAFSLWKVLAAAGLAVVTAFGAGQFVGDLKGTARCELAHANAVRVESEKHSAWLAQMGKLTGDDTTEAAAVELSNDEIQRRIERALSKPADLRVCIPADFLRGVHELR